MLRLATTLAQTTPTGTFVARPLSALAVGAGSSSNWTVGSLCDFSSAAGKSSPTAVDESEKPPTAADYGLKFRLPKWEQEFITREAEEIISRAYKRHHADGNESERYPVRPPNEDLEKLGPVYHYTPKSMSDKVAYGLVQMVKPLTHLFFRERYLSHACVLEVVAACPGFVAGAMRHMRSLHNMSRDHGWIHHLLEEASNERMHLLTWLSVMQPSRIERFTVITAQAVYVTLYAMMYAISPKTSHRFVGYLEEEAVAAYTQLLDAIDNGTQDNYPAPDIAKKYWRLPDDAMLRDVVLHVRADEWMHALVNHRMSEIVASSGPDTPLDVPPQYPSSVGLPPDHPDRVATRDSIHSRPPSSAL